MARGSRTWRAHLSGGTRAAFVTLGAIQRGIRRLARAFRQAAASRIIINAHRINQGLMPDLSAPAGDSDFYFVPAEGPETAVQRILELVKTRIPKRFRLNPIRDIQVLCPMNRGGVGARSLNIELQAALNPAGERKVERFGWTLAPVTQIENDYDKGEAEEFRFHKVVNEPDFLPVFFVRHLVEVAKLVRQHRGQKLRYRAF